MSESAPPPAAASAAPPSEVPIDNNTPFESTPEVTPIPTSSFKVYKPSSSTAAPPPLSDDYFNPTPTDLKLAQSTLAARTQALANAPLQLRAVRDAAEKSKRDRWPNTTIRIRFTDRTQLEKVFASSSKIRVVYAFVRASLRDDVKPVKFVLYQPPKRDLKVSDPSVRDLTLAELYLAPSSVLLLRFEDAAHEEARALNGSDMPAPLAPEVLSQAIDLPVPPPSDAPSPSSAPSASSSQRAQSSSSTEKKIPKWLKLGLKK